MEIPVGGESSTISFTSDSTPEWKYDVFLSFAGKDTRLKFTGHLYDAFNRSGINTFRDDVDLERGGVIKDDLFQAIEDSLCSVLVMSENYANSTWCLEELQKILESKKKLGRHVFPIFYDVDPADVRKQQNSFGKALAEHEKEFGKDTEKVRNWKNVLFEIGSLAGWDTRSKHEADLITNIVEVVWIYLCSKSPSFDDNLVGIDSKIGDMMPYLEIGLDDVLFVGIWGIGGVGKTTLARAIFEKISQKFGMHCFINNVKEISKTREGQISLQKKLLSDLKIKNLEICDVSDGKKKIRDRARNIKLLLILDDVDDMSQLVNLVESPMWFGKGSRIIITTRDRHLLTSARVQRIYEMKTMKEDESRELFSNKAFDKNHPKDDYLELSKFVVEYTGGLPLALDVLGAFLYRRSLAEWTDALDRLKQNPDDKILQVLEISYDGLNKEEKTIFLDIACFFRGWRKDEVTQILESCDLHPTIGIKVLIEKTLLVEMEDYLGGCILEMHDLLQQLGTHIISRESNNIHERSRLWLSEDIEQVLKSNKGSQAIQAIVPVGTQYPVEVHKEALSSMSNIRLLIIRGSYFRGGLIRCLPSSLKFLGWNYFPLEDLSLETPLLDKLVAIKMTHSKIKRLWNGIQSMKKLKHIDLSHSRDLIETPDFSEAPNLEYLILVECSSLVRVHPSFGELKKLVRVNLSGCNCLQYLPRKLKAESLIELNLSSCFEVAVLPKFGKRMKRLSLLDASSTSATKLPESFRYLTGLKELNLSNCNFRDESIFDHFGNLSSLVVLDLGRNGSFVNLPAGCFSSLFRLLYLFLDNCNKLQSLPKLPPRLIRLDAMRCDSMESLTDDQLWNLVASLDHKYRSRAKYESSLLNKIESEHLPQRDFFAIFPGCDIPSWFPNKEPIIARSKSYYGDDPSNECVIKVDIPQYFHASEWSGIVVCLNVSRYCYYKVYENMVRESFGDETCWISWSSKALEDDDYIYKGWDHCFRVIDHPDEDLYDHGPGHGFYYDGTEVTGHLCVMVLELNEKTCWQHLRAHNNSIQIKIRLHRPNFGWDFCMSGCGWRVLCKEDIEQWCNTTHDSNKLTEEVAEVDTSQIFLPNYVLSRTIEVRGSSGAKARHKK